MYRNMVVHHLNHNTIQQPLEYEKFDVDSRLCYFKPNHAQKTASFAEEISHSLSQNFKSISPKFFYDQRGSELFEEICQLPEYYLTRTEIQILKKIQNELPEHLTDDFRLVELGSGSSVKTRLLLDIFTKLQDKIEYLPIDISEFLKDSCHLLLEDYENLHVTGIVDTYEQGLEFVKNFDDKPHLIIFLGSSFGNFAPEDGKNFLKKIQQTMKESDLFLIGLDLVKDKQVLERAYDDSQGVTAKFNLNVLSRINNELEGNFELENFSHSAEFNEDKKRIEMYLKSHSNQIVDIPKADLSLEFKENELIHTEHSHKYTVSDIEDMMEVAGLQINRIWLDDNRHYSMILASKI